MSAFGGKADIGLTPRMSAFDPERHSVLSIVATQNHRPTPFRRSTTRAFIEEIAASRVGMASCCARAASKRVGDRLSGPRFGAVRLLSCHRYGGCFEELFLTPNPPPPRALPPSESNHKRTNACRLAARILRSRVLSAKVRMSSSVLAWLFTSPSMASAPITTTPNTIYRIHTKRL